MITVPEAANLRLRVLPYEDKKKLGRCPKPRIRNFLEKVSYGSSKTLKLWVNLVNVMLGKVKLTFYSKI